MRSNVLGDPVGFVKTLMVLCSGTVAVLLAGAAVLHLAFVRYEQDWA